MQTNINKLKEIKMITTVAYWRSKFSEITKEQVKRCGCSHDLYMQNVSNAIDSILDNANLGKEEHQKALELAINEFNYISPKQLKILEEESIENGFCSHGLDPDCCNMGCGEY